MSELNAMITLGVATLGMMAAIMQPLIGGI